ncbi:hypothetical protein IVB14_24435 [Bradyrhizobium sp. 180]|uniref:hypothetical protein n=1 Tax=Bradyrhizobium sp. 180 TaxID=2782650 RepID=UPI001FFBA4E9|nr:hypothetical protein [Bradyrhizobium sp. 180]MCK1493486.1 hypothetical protein [Bradyrhizobium sp. 180]
MLIDVENGAGSMPGSAAAGIVGPMTPDQVANAVSKPLSILKDLPAWLLSGVACAAAILLFVPSVGAQLPPEARPYLWSTAILFGCLAVFRWLAMGIEALRSWRASRRPQKTFHLTAMSGMWHSAKQVDGSTIVQIVADLLVKNQSEQSIGLVRPRIIRPRRLRSEVVQSDVMVRAPRANVYGTAFISGHVVPPGMSLPAQAHIMVRRRAPRAQGNDLPVLLALTDEDGNEQRLWVTCKGQPASTKGSKPIPSEPIHAIKDPIAKDIAAILQAEAARYEKNGRSGGGFGSLHITTSGAPINGFGQDGWQTRTTRNQEILDDPSSVDLHSDNLDAILKLYDRFTPDDERSRLLAALRDRLGQPGYARVSYFIVCALWRLGDLDGALFLAAAKLPQEDAVDFGLSNTLYMLNGLLRYVHPDFSEADLDCIEKLVDSVGSGSFHIRQKIAAIRAWRVHSAPTT